MSEALDCKLCKYELQGAEDIPCVSCGVNRFEPKEQSTQDVAAKSRGVTAGQIVVEEV